MIRILLGSDDIQTGLGKASPKKRLPKNHWQASGKDRHRKEGLAGVGSKGQATGINGSAAARAAARSAAGG